MIDMRMHATVADEAHQMQLPTAAALHRVEQQRLPEKFTRGNFRIEARDIHLHDAARADIQVADFAVAHLAFGQSDKWAGSVDQNIGEFLEQRVVIWLAREGDCVALRLRRVAPAVEHGQHNWFWSFRHGDAPEYTELTGKPNREIYAAVRSEVD